MAITVKREDIVELNKMQKNKLSAANAKLLSKQIEIITRVNEKYCIIQDGDPTTYKNLLENKNGGLFLASNTKARIPIIRKAGYVAGIASGAATTLFIGLPLMMIQLAELIVKGEGLDYLILSVAVTISGIIGITSSVGAWNRASDNMKDMVAYKVETEIVKGLIALKDDSSQNNQ
jgi:hypothetical protein